MLVTGAGARHVSVALRAALQAQRAAVARGAPDYRRRMKALADLRAAVRAHQTELQRAVSDDFGGRADDETLMLELFPFYDQVRHARGHLKGWMRRKRVASSRCGSRSTVRGGPPGSEL